jgi:hypothetical protein
MGMVCIASLPSMVPPCWTCFVLFHFMFHWFIINGHCLHCIVCSVSFHASLVHSYCTSFVLFHFPHWFITAGHGLYCFTFCFTGPSLLGMNCIVSFHASSVHHHWVRLALFGFMLHRFIICGICFLLFHCMFHWFFIFRHGLYYFTSIFTGASLLRIVCIVSSNASLVHHSRAWFALFHLMLHWFIINGHCLHYFTSCITVHPYCTWILLFHFMHDWFFFTEHLLYFFTSCFIGSFLLDIACIVHSHHWFITAGHRLHLITSCFTGLFLLDIVCIVSFLC